MYDMYAYSLVYMNILDMIWFTYIVWYLTCDVYIYNRDEIYM